MKFDTAILGALLQSGLFLNSASAVHSGAALSPSQLRKQIMAAGFPSAKGAVTILEHDHEGEGGDAREGGEGEADHDHEGEHGDEPDDHDHEDEHDREDGEPDDHDHDAFWDCPPDRPWKCAPTLSPTDAPTAAPTAGATVAAATSWFTSGNLVRDTEVGVLLGIVFIVCASFVAVVALIIKFDAHKYLAFRILQKDDKYAQEINNFGTAIDVSMRPENDRLAYERQHGLQMGVPNRSMNAAAVAPSPQRLSSGQIYAPEAWASVSDVGSGVDSGFRDQTVNPAASGIQGIDSSKKSRKSRVGKTIDF